MPRPTRKLKDPALLSAALEGLELQRQRLDEQIRQVRSMLGPGRRPMTRVSGAEPMGAAAPRRRNLSPAARKRIAAAQRKRWAEYRRSREGQASE